ncbi:MAG: hypothetical protein C4534_02060 [Gaiellales bacterium]|nr:MAG: hypothetical protein C4534_02060 [Gaiellales bacterium]
MLDLSQAHWNTSPDKHRILDDQDRIIADVDAGWRQEFLDSELDQIADLIAAAPQLLAAVQITLQLLDNLTTEEFSRGGDKPAREALQAAFTAATGNPEAWRQSREESTPPVPAQPHPHHDLVGRQYQSAFGITVKAVAVDHRHQDRVVVLESGPTETPCRRSVNANTLRAALGLPEPRDSSSPA